MNPANRHLLCLLVAVCASVATSAVSAPHLDRSVSTSHQFIVYGGEARLRGSVAELAEHVKGTLLTFLQIPDRWSIPIVVRIDQAQANVPELPPSKLNLSQTGAGLKIQLDFLFQSDTDPVALERELLRAILLEISYRRLPSLPADAPYVSPPDWLVEGILAVRNQPGSVTNTIENLATPPVRLAECLTQRPSLLDSQSRDLHCAAAWALLNIITQRQEGRAQLARYIADLPHASADTIADFQKHFPWFGKDSAELEQTWTTLVRRLAGEHRFILETFSSTARQLDELRQTKIGIDATGKTPLTLEQSLRVNRPKIDLSATAELAQRFAVLGGRAHPLLRSIVLEYQLAAQSVTRKKTGGWSKRLARAGELSDQIGSRMRQVEDFLNWFEATQPKSVSGDFQDYLRAAQSDLGAGRRRDPLSVYLDAMELQLQ